MRGAPLCQILAAGAVAWWLAAGAAAGMNRPAEASGSAGAASPLRTGLARAGMPLAIVGALCAAGLIITFTVSESLKEERIAPRRFVFQLRRLLTAGRLEEAVAACKRNRSAAALIALAALDYHRRARPPDPLLLRDIMAGELHRQRSQVEHQVRYLREIADLAPVVGLLGAGLAWLSALSGVELDAARARADVLGAGLTQAWTSTGAGLAVGVFALLAHAFFRGRVRRWGQSLEGASADVYQLLARKSAPRWPRDR